MINTPFEFRIRRAERRARRIYLTTGLPMFLCRIVASMVQS